MSSRTVYAGSIFLTSGTALATTSAVLIAAGTLTPGNYQLRLSCRGVPLSVTGVASAAVAITASATNPMTTVGASGYVDSVSVSDRLALLPISFVFTQATHYEITKTITVGALDNVSVFVDHCSSLAAYLSMISITLDLNLQP